MPDENEINELSNSDWKFVLGDVRGRRVIKELLDISNVFESNEYTDIIAVAKCEGRRSIGIHISNKVLNIAKNRFTQMFEEAQAVNNEIEKEENV
ncbi:MAG: hypothetical protein LBL00_07815 [Endomicrobium sp.]|jgi:hypothetical protein|nr:hypothetical protein [Endomicrobium sp.]